MREIAIYEAKTRLSELLAEVEQGEQVTITRRGLPVARLVPVATAKRGGLTQRQKVSDAMTKLQAARIQLDGTLKDWLGEGRD